MMWPEGKLSITEVTKRPLTAATLFKNSMIALVDNLASKVNISVAESTPASDLWRNWVTLLHSLHLGGVVEGMCGP